MGLTLLEKTPDFQFFKTLLNFVTKLVEIMINKVVVGSGHGDVPKYVGRVWITQDTWHSGCAIAVVLLSVYGHFRQFCGGHTSDMPCLHFKGCCDVICDVTVLHMHWSHDLLL